MKATKMVPDVLTLTLVIPLHRGTGPGPRFGLTPRSKTIWIRSSTFAALNSSEEGQSGQLGPGYTHILVLHLWGH
jgi:hypothetical protein